MGRCQCARIDLGIRRSDFGAKVAVADFYRPSAGTAYADLTVGQKALVDAAADPADYGMPDADAPIRNSATRRNPWSPTPCGRAPARPTPT